MAAASTWWIEWARQTARDAVTTVEGERVEVFARKCYRLFFQKNMEKEMYFQCCCLVWIVQCIDRGATAGELWEATQQAMQVVGDDSCISGWILPPKLPLDNHGSNLLITATTDEDSEEHYLNLLIHFWKLFYQACEESHLPTRPTKRQRTHYQYSYAYSSGTSSSLPTNSLDDLMKGSYKLAAIILWSNVHVAFGVDSWQDLHDLVYGLPQIFKTLTSDDVQAALAVVGMQYVIQGRNISGLSPRMLIDKYLTRAGESCLSLLKEKLSLDYYTLRAAICDHLLEPVYSPNDFTMTEQETQATIHACCIFLNREQPSTFLQQIQKPIIVERRDTINSVPEHIQSPRYPLITHLSVWLLDNDLSRAIELARLMDTHPMLDGLWKDEAYLMIWQHLLRQGQIFLDGNYTETVPYMDKRELLYNGIVNGIGPYGCGSMMDFYQALAQKVWDHPQATSNEKAYVLLACQQTLLRLLIKCRGLGDDTIVEFLQKTKWPVAVQEIKGIPSTDIQIWAAKFLSQRNPIPESLLLPKDDNDDDDDDRGYGVLDLTRLVEEDTLPSPTTEALPDEELQPRELLTDSSPAKQHNQALEEEEDDEQVEVVNIDEEEIEDDNVVDEENDDKYVEAEQVDEDEEVSVEEDYEQYEEEANQDDDEEAIEIQDEENDVQIVDNESSDATGQDNHDDSTAEMDSNDPYEYEEEEEDSPPPQRGLPEHGNNNRPYPSSHEDDQDKKPPARLHVPIRMERRYMDDLEGHEPDDDGTSEEDVAANDLSSDGNDDDDDDDDEEQDDNHGGDNEAVVIADSDEEEDNDDDKPVRHRIANYGDIRSEGHDNSDEHSSGVEQYPNSEDDDSDDGQEGDQIRDRPHRIIQGEVDGYSSNASEPEVVGGDAGVYQAVPVIQRGDLIDSEEPSSDEEAFNQPNRVAQAADVVNEPIEIIDCSDDDDDDDDADEDEDENEKDRVDGERDAAFVETNRLQEPEALRPDSQRQVARLSIDLHNEAARAMITMFDATSNVNNPAGNSSVDDDSGTMEQSREVERPYGKASAGDDNSSVGDQERIEATAQSDEQNDMEETQRLHPSANADEAPFVDDVPHLRGHTESGELPVAHALDGNDGDSDASDDEDERIVEVEKAETEDAAVGGEFGDTTEEESEVPTSSRANMLADAVRRADVLRARSGYTSHLEEGYEPEDTHGYTEEEVSEAIHTEDEEDERRATQESRKVEVVEEQRKKVERDPHSVPHSSDDMDAADEHTEHEEDLGAESSELEETTEARDYPYSPSSEVERDPTTLLEFAQSAQRLHRYGTRSAALQKTPVHASHENERDRHSYAGKKTTEIFDRALNTQAEGINESEGQSLEVDDDVDEQTSDNFASVEDDKEADSTMATESIGMTEGTVELVDSEDHILSKSTQIVHVHDADTDVEEEDVEQQDRFSDEQEEENMNSTGEMAVDSHVESQDAMLAEESWPESTTQANLMETDSPIREHNNDMDVDENLTRVDDQVMVEGSGQLGDEVMEAETLIRTGTTTTDEDVEHVVMKEATNDEVSVDEGLQSPSPNVDAAMDTNPTSPTESHLEETVANKLNHGEANEDYVRSPALENVEQEQGALHDAENFNEIDKKHRSPTKVFSQDHGRQRDEVPDDEVGRSKVLPVEGVAHDIDDEDNAASNMSSSGPVRRSKRRKGAIDSIGPTFDGAKASPNIGRADTMATPVQNDESEAEIENLAVAPSNASGRQTRSVEGGQDRKDDESAVSEVSHPLTNEATATHDHEVDDGTPRNSRTQSMNIYSAENLVLVSRRARKGIEQNAAEKAGSSVNDTPNTSRRARKPVSEELEPKTPPTTRKRAKKSSTVKDKSMQSTPQRRRGRPKKPTPEEDESVTSTTRTTRGRGKKPSSEHDESIKSPTQATFGQEKETTADEDVSTTNTPRSIRGRAKKGTAEDDDTTERSSRSTHGRATKSATTEDEPVASTSRSTRGRAKKINQDDDESLASAPRTTRGRTKTATTEEAESVASPPRNTRGRAKKPPTDDEESTASTTPKTRRRQPKKLSTENDDTKSSATPRGRVNKATTDDEASAASAVHYTRSRNKKPDAKDDESVTSAVSSTKGANKRSRQEDLEEEDDESDSMKKPVASRASSRKGLPPRVPPRSGARTRSKK